MHNPDNFKRYTRRLPTLSQVLNRPNPLAVDSYYKLCMAWQSAGLRDEVAFNRAQWRALTIDRVTGRETYGYGKFDE